MIFATFKIAITFVFRCIARATCCFSKKRSPIALSNINLCFSINNKNELKRNNKILKGSFLSLGQALSDFLLLRFYNKKNINKFVNIVGRENLEQAIGEDKGVILSTAHFGSWELAAHCLALSGFKSLILYNPIKKPLWLENFVKKNREISGNILKPKQNSFLSLYRHLRQKKIVTLIADQNCLPSDGKRVPLFGHNVWTHTGLVKLSLKTGAPIVPGFIFTKSLSRYELDIFEPLYPEDFRKYDDPEYQMALASNKALEKAIKRAPDQWMWQHRRFKNLS